MHILWLKVWTRCCQRHKAQCNNNSQPLLEMTYSLPTHNNSGPPSVSIATPHMWLFYLRKLLIWLKYTQPLYYIYLPLSLLLCSLPPSPAFLLHWCHCLFFSTQTQGKEGWREKRKDEYLFLQIPHRRSSSDNMQHRPAPSQSRYLLHSESAPSVFSFFVFNKILMY